MKLSNRGGFPNTPAALLVIAALFGMAGALQARQFRGMRPIATPVATAVNLPDGARPVANIKPLSREQIEPLVRKLMEAWNTPALSDKLDEGFYDKSRLTDAIDRIAPRDATLRVQSLQGVQTLSQYLIADPEARGREKLVSVVSATVRTQLEFNDPSAGFVRRPGVNEYILKVTQPAPLP